MNRIQPHSLALSFGIFLGLWHALWSLLVAVGAAQWLLDFIFKLHMISPPYTVGPFNLMTAVELVAVTGALGYLIGWALAVIWNRYAVR